MTKHKIDTSEIERALHHGEFCFHFQPKVSFVSGEIVGGEALLRWIKPDGTVIFPGQFLPLAESSGFITNITAVMLPELIENIETIRKTKADIQIAFNISARDLDSPYLVKMLRSFIGSKRINPGNIQVEITETAVVDNSDRIMTSLLDLVALGVEIAMDDFGTGYSSLDLLSRLPISALKLDQGVVLRMTKDVKSTHIVRSSLYMARELSIKTIAEGVESKGTYTYLMSAGCNEVQGHWISPAIGIEEYTKLCSDEPRWPGSTFGLLYNAWVNHISYRRKVLDAALTLAMTHPDEWAGLPKMDLAHSPARCRLSQWYMGEVGEGGNTRREFKQLEEPHRLMHAAGASLIKSIRDRSGTRDISRATRIFLEYSDVVDAEVSRIVERDLEKIIDKLGHENTLARELIDGENVIALDLKGKKAK
ncbi:MAG: EAL domain-containing protein [Rhodospirillaceae bacterium]|nr:EAL domain-containing protein [Rhodospirillaceae bacterium]